MALVRGDDFLQELFKVIDDEVQGLRGGILLGFLAVELFIFKLSCF